MRVHVEPEVDGGAKVEDVDDKEKARETNPPEGFRPSRKVMQGESDLLRMYACEGDIDDLR